MKRAILPLVFAVALLVAFLVFNKQPNAAGYVLAIGIGLGIGAILNSFIFKKSETAPESNQTINESTADESNEDLAV